MRPNEKNATKRGTKCRNVTWGSKTRTQKRSCPNERAWWTGSRGKRRNQNPNATEKTRVKMNWKWEVKMQPKNERAGRVRGVNQRKSSERNVRKERENENEQPKCRWNETQKIWKPKMKRECGWKCIQTYQRGKLNRNNETVGETAWCEVRETGKRNQQTKENQTANNESERENEKTVNWKDQP